MKLKTVQPRQKIKNKLYTDFKWGKGTEAKGSEDRKNNAKKDYKRARESIIYEYDHSKWEKYSR